MSERDGVASWVKQHLQKMSLAELLDVRVIGFSCALAWYFVVFFSKTIHYSTRNNITSHFNSVFGWSCAGLLLVMGLAIFAPSILKRISAHKVFRHGATVAVCGTTIVLVCVENYLFTQPWCSISSFIAGAGFGLIVLAWMQDFTTRSVETSIVMAAASLILASLLFAIITSIPLPAGIVLTVLLPIISDVILTWRCQIWLSHEDGRSSNVTRLERFKKPLLGLVIICMVASFVQILFLRPESVIHQPNYSWFLFIAALLATALVGTALFSQQTMAYNTTFQVAIYALCFIFLLLPILESGSAPASIFALTIFCLLVALIWPLLISIGQQHNLSTLLIGGIGISAQAIGALIGTFGGALLAVHVELTPRLLSIIALVGVLILTGCRIGLLSNSALAQLTGSKDTLAPNKRTFKERIETVAEIYGLTPREAEILELVVKGRSKPRIQSITGLTAGTVNTHLSHIYSKLDLHDKQDILDLVEQIDEV